MVHGVTKSLLPSVSVFYRGDLECLQQFVSKYLDNFEEVYANADFRVYKVRLAGAINGMPISKRRQPYREMAT